MGYIKNKLLFFSKRSRGGYTLVEMMVVVAIIGLIFSIVPQFFYFATKFQRLNTARVDIQKDGRAAMSLINKNLRQAVSNSIVIDSLNTIQPPYSRITFTKQQGDIISYYQEGKNLLELKGGRTYTVADNLRYLGFVFPRSDDIALVSVSITLEEAVSQSQSKALQMSVEKVKIMN